MKYLETSLGNHRFEFNGKIITAWIVVGNETICICLDGYIGEWLRLKGKFKKVYDKGVEGMQDLLESKVDLLKKWLPIAISTAEQKELEEVAKRNVEQARKQKLIDKDRAIQLYRSVSISKGKHKISIVTQPYQSGIYIAISDSKLSSLIQTGSKTHRSTNNMIDKIMKKLETEGYKVTSSKQKIDYSQF